MSHKINLFYLAKIEGILNKKIKNGEIFSFKIENNFLKINLTRKRKITLSILNTPKDLLVNLILIPYTRNMDDNEKINHFKIEFRNQKLIYLSNANK